MTNFLNSIKKPIQIGKQVRCDKFETYIRVTAKKIGALKLRRLKSSDIRDTRKNLWEETSVWRI